MHCYCLVNAHPPLPHIRHTHSSYQAHPPPPPHTAHTLIISGTPPPTYGTHTTSGLVGGTPGGPFMAWWIPGLENGCWHMTWPAVAATHTRGEIPTPGRRDSACLIGRWTRSDLIQIPSDTRAPHFSHPILPLDRLSWKKNRDGSVSKMAKELDVLHKCIISIELGSFFKPSFSREHEKYFFFLSSLQ